jgi:hypothetical protein
MTGGSFPSYINKIEGVLCVFEKGQHIRVIGDTFKIDPHGLEIGSIHEVHSISPAIKQENFPSIVKFMFRLEGKELHDLPERVHVKTGESFQDYANLVYEDVELYLFGEVMEPPSDDEEDYEDYIYEVQMLEDDVTDGYNEGDIFSVYVNKEGEPFFYDLDGDARYLHITNHMIVK